jgi:hypothetical protein
MNKHYGEVAQRAGHRCEYCCAPEVIFNLPFEVEHIVPTSEHGPDDQSNLALASRSCNLFKSNQQSGIDDATAELVRLFHPRLDRWDEHFRADSADGTICGLTSVGRATIACLRMNRDIHRQARRAWMALKLYP